MPDWISVNPAELNITEREAGERGAEITIGLSPDDVPERIRGRFVHKSDEYVIAFQYLTATNEPRIRVALPNGKATAIVGSRSKRLYRLRIRVPEGEQLPPEIDLVLDTLAKDRRFVNRQRHFKVAGEAVSDNADALAHH